jgi:hypothetical protein
MGIDGLEIATSAIHAPGGNGDVVHVEVQLSRRQAAAAPRFVSRKARDAWVVPIRRRDADQRRRECFVQHYAKSIPRSDASLERG